MAGRSNEVQKSVNTIVAEAGVTLDTRLLRKNIIILALKIANNFTKALSWSATVELSNSIR
jgi:hypothetical protein